MTTLLKKKLHEFAILRGWYKDITTGCHLNIIRTVFRTYAFEGIYTMQSLGSLIAEIREFDMESVEAELVTEIRKLDTAHEAALAEVKYLKSVLDERYESEWRITKDGTKRYRKVATKVLVNAWHTESEPLDLR